MPHCTNVFGDELGIIGYRPRGADLRGSMSRIASRVDDTMIESCWSTMPRELLDTRTWDPHLGAAIVE